MPIPGVMGSVGGLASGPFVSLSPTYNVNDVTVSPTNASASFSLENDGDIARITVSTGGGGTVDVGDWITPRSAAGADYECFVTVDSGALSSGTTGSWLALNTTRTWTLDQTSLGTSTCVFGLQIRRASTGSVLDSTTVTLEAEKTI